MSLSTQSAAIEVEHLSRRFGDFLAVRDVSFQVQRGEIFGYLGANGAGKSTTIRMLCGLLAPSEGDAIVDGERISGSPERVKARIGYMSQKFSLYPDLTVRHNLEFYGGAYGLGGRDLKRRIELAAERAGLQGIEDRLTGALPGGIRQRVALASAILHEPGIVFLDEPTAGVDPEARRAFWRLIRSLSTEGTTVFVTTHYMDEAEYCARIGLMVSGRLAALDTPAGLKRTHVPGRTWAIGVADGNSLHTALGPLRALPGVLEVQPFGAGAHIRLAEDAPTGPAEIADALTAQGLPGVHVEETEPSLEDVFLAVVSRDAQDAGTAQAFDGAAG